MLLSLPPHEHAGCSFLFQSLGDELAMIPLPECEPLLLVHVTRSDIAQSSRRLICELSPFAKGTARVRLPVVMQQRLAQVVCSMVEYESLVTTAH